MNNLLAHQRLGGFIDARHAQIDADDIIGAVIIILFNAHGYGFGAAGECAITAKRQGSFKSGVGISQDRCAAYKLSIDIESTMRTRNGSIVKGGRHGRIDVYHIHNGSVRKPGKQMQGVMVWLAVEDAVGQAGFIICHVKGLYLCGAYPVGLCGANLHEAANAAGLEVRFGVAYRTGGDGYGYSYRKKQRGYIFHKYPFKMKLFNRSYSTLTRFQSKCYI